ncbi:NUC194 [Trinorchestia longiramus]|nr:NUC194 [Trinorchestia longiramus]
MKRELKKNPRLTAIELKNLHSGLLQNIAVRAIQHRLQKDLGLPCRRTAAKPLINDCMKKKRIAFAKKYKRWTQAQWRKLMFSGESNFLVFRTGSITVRRPVSSDRYDPRYSVPTVKHLNLMMVWGAYSGEKGRGGLHFLRKKLKAERAPCHKAKKVTTFLQERQIEVLEWPANSPDLNPMENYCHNLQQLVEQHVRSTEQQQWFVSVVLERGGHKSYEALIEPGRSTPVPAQPQRWALFLKHVLACVEAHLWLIGQRLVLATLLLSHSSSHVVDVLHHFVLHVGPGLRHPRTCVPGSLIHTQCTLIVRLMDFVTVVLAESKEASLTLLTQLLCPEFFEVLAAAVLEPLSLGFNLRDTEVFQKLLPRLTELLKAAGRSLNEPQKQLFVKAVDRIMASDQRLLPALLPLDATHLTVPIHTRHYLQGVAVLHETRWLEHAAGDTAKVSLARHITLWARHLLTPPPSAVLRAEASPHLLQFCSDALHIALRLREETVAEMIELLSGSGNQDGDAVHQDIVMKVLVQRSSFCVGRCAELSRAGCVRPAVRLLLALARVLMKESSLRNRYSKELVENAVSVWTTFLASSGGTSSGGEASWSAVSGKGDLVALMALLMLIDQDQIIATHCNAAHPAAGAAAHPATGAAAPASCAIFDFWLHIISDDKTELHLKLTCMQLLPFFCTMVDGVQLKVVEALEYFSVHHLPLKSTEYPVGSARDRDLRRCLTLLLTALELSASLPLLMHIVQLFCREPQHRYQHLLEKSIEKMSSGMSTDAQLAAVIRVYDKIESQLAMGLQQNRLLLSKLVLLPLLRSAQVVCVERFYVRYLVHIMGYLTGPLTSRSDMQQVALTSKLVALRVMQLMYAKLSRDQCFSSASAVNASFSPQDTSGKALTKEVMKCAVRLAKGELRHDKTNHELRRECASAAYCLLISLLVNVQNDLKFYTNFLFIQNKEKGEALWASMIDTDHQWDFGVEMNVEGGRKSHLVAVRQAANSEASKTGPEGHHQPTVLMFESRYLSNCSLSQDLSQYDFSSALVLSFGEKKKQGQIREDDNGTLVPVTLETCDYNKHEVMPELTAALLHMKTLENQRSPLPPAWMTELLREISSSSTARNVRLFLLRLMTNTSQIFAAHAREVSRAVLCCINDGTAGRGCNYFVADLVVMLVGWGEAGAPTDPADQPMTIELLRRLVVSLPHLRADVFRYNVDLLRGLVAVWRTAWGVVDGSAIAELLETQDGENREVEAGLHAAACLLVSNVAPCDETNSLQVSRLRKALLRSMRSPRAAVYNAAAEVIGLILSRAAAKGGSASDSSTASLPRACAELADEVTPCIMELITKQQAQGLSALFHIHKHFPAIANRFASKLLVLLPMLYGLQKMRALECLIMPLSAMPNCFQHLSQQRITDVLLTREPASQLVLLRLLNSCFTTLSAEESLHFLPSLLGFLKHPVSSCREVLYSSLTFLHDRYRDGSSSHQKEIWNLAHDALLRAVADEDTQLRQFILDYWTQSAISLTAQELLLYILRDLYSVGSEHTFLHTACHVLLQLTHSSPSYSRTLFEHPLTECKFWEMRVCPAWQARHASMVNLFSNTQGSAEANGAPSVSQLVALTQGGEEVGHVLGVVAATQHKQFTQTQAAPTESMSSTFNFGPGATIREDVSLTELQDKTNTVSQGPAGLVFSLAPNSKQSYSKTGLGITRLKPKIFGDEDNKDGSASVVASTLIRRRFQRQQDREKQARYFAEAEEKRRLLQMRLEREKKLRREAQVTMIREYRVGELPDIQIKQQAVIDPLQALTERDSIVAEHMFVILIEGLMQHGENWLSNEEFEQWREQVRVALCSLLSDSVQHSPKVMASVLHLLLSFKMTFPPDTVTNVCLSSGQEPLGVLLLEQQILSMQKQLRLSPPKKKQKRCIVGETTNCSETDIFKVQLHLAELYSSLSMWDAVRGVLQSGSSLHASTAEALLYESLDQPLQAYELYLAALAAPDMQHTVEEQKVWEDRVCSTASELGMWGVLDSFVDRRLIRDPATEKADPERLWQLSRPSTTISVFLNARLVKLFEGSHSDGGLVQFVNNAMKEESRKLLLENNVGLQLAVLSVNQEKLHLARSFLSAATDALLAKLGHQSLAFSKPLTSSLRELQLLMELEQFLNVHENSMKEKNELILRLCSQWMKNLPTSSDNIVFTQFLVFYRDVYFHFLKKKTTGCVWKKIHETKVTSHIAVTEIALGTNNTLLASQHLFKLDALLQMGRLSENLAVKYHFLRTQNSICRGRQKSGAERIKLLVNAWCKQLGNVNKLQSSSHSPTIDMEYLCFESKLCVELCHAIESLDGDLDSAKSHLDLVAQKFPIVREDPRSWYRNLLQCGFSALTQACDLRSKQISDKELTDSTKIDTCKSYETLAVYCEDCINSWPGSIDMTEYRKTLVSSTLKAMSSGSRVAHFNFPRLIHLMEAHSGLLEVFEREVASVPLWMFLLWLPHILIYLEKIPGQVLRPIVVQLAEEYPQAVFYPFSVSKTCYKFDGEMGPAVRAMCYKIEEIMDTKCGLLQPFLNAITLVREPFGVLKQELMSVRSATSSQTKVTKLRAIHEQLFKANSPLSGKITSLKNPSLQSTGSQLGGQYNLIFEKLKGIFKKFFGETASKIQVSKLKDLDICITSLLSCWSKSLTDVKGVSPWLSNFQGSHYSEKIEVPGLYTGFSKPCVDYHPSILNFDNDLHVFTSLRRPAVIKMHADDEKTYQFLIKSGEDLRTDQRIEQMFALMNNIFANSSVTKRLSAEPKVSTFNVVPLTPELGMLQWVDGTTTLKVFMESSLADQEKETYEISLKRFSSAKSNLQLLNTKKTECVEAYLKCVNSLPWDLLRRSLMNLSTSYDNFFLLRTKFCSSHAVFSIAQWLLGIGDRHLSNFLVEFKTAKIVGIDFDHHFETATQFLSHPELMPFRMSPQIVNVAQPLSTKGIIRESMVSCMQALVSHKRVILAAVEAFVKEPTQGWLRFVQRQEGTVSEKGIELYSAKRMEFISEKLSGINPCQIIDWAVRHNTSLDSATKSFLSTVVQGKDEKRESSKKTGLSVPEQVDTLLELAMDPNILGRTYPGWSPCT